MLRLAARRTAGQVRQAGARAFATQQTAPATQAADLDWDGLSDTMGSDAAKRELQLLRTTFLDVQQKLADMTKEPEPIDWEHWKKELDPALVSSFQQAYTSMPLPKYEDASEKEVAQAFDELVQQAGDLSKHSETRVKEIEEEIKALDKELDRVSKLTIDDVLEAEPELGKRLHKEIGEGKFI